MRTILNIIGASMLIYWATILLIPYTVGEDKDSNYIIDDSVQKPTSMPQDSIILKPRDTTPYKPHPATDIDIP